VTMWRPRFVVADPFGRTSRICIFLALDGVSMVLHRQVELASVISHRLGQIAHLSSMYNYKYTSIIVQRTNDSRSQSLLRRVGFPQ
jgi:hypothetical protein